MLTAVKIPFSMRSLPWTSSCSMIRSQSVSLKRVRRQMICQLEKRQSDYRSCADQSTTTGSWLRIKKWQPDAFTLERTGSQMRPRDRNTPVTDSRKPETRMQIPKCTQEILCGIQTVLKFTTSKCNREGSVMLKVHRVSRKEGLGRLRWTQPKIRFI
jgi:hypothetical protein